MYRKIITSVSALLLLPVLTFASAAEELKIGAIGSLSGGGTQWGLAVQRGTQLAIDEINAQGGVKVGDKTYNPVLIMYDDQYTGQGAVTAATRLINVDGVKFIIGPNGSAPVLAALGVTTPAKILVLSDGFSPRVLTPQSHYNFRVHLTSNEFAPSLIKWVRTTYPEAKRVGIVSPNDATGQTVVPVLTAAYEQNKFEVVAKEGYERGVSDFTPLLTRLIATRIDVLELDSNAPGETGLLVRQARQLGFKGVIIQTGGPAYDEVIKVAGRQAEGFITFDFFTSDDPAAAPFVRAYRAKYEGPIDPFAPIMFNATRLLFEAMRRAGTLEVDNVRNEFAKLDGFDSLFGPVRWGGQEKYGINHQLLHSFLIIQVKDGKGQAIDRITPEQ